MQQVIDIFHEQLPTFVEEATDLIRSEHIQTYEPFDREQVRSLVDATYRAFESDLINNTTTSLPSYLQGVGPRRAEQGALVQDMLWAMEIGIGIATSFFKQRFADNATALVWWLDHNFNIMYAAAIGLSQMFVTVRERVIREQALQLREVSTPIVPIYNGILVLPLVGGINAQRAGQIMEALLEAIIRHVAEAVIIDITGVPVVDTSVANYLLQTTRAVGLIGSRVILVGISPEIALTIIHLGVDLGSITTRANLEDGIAYALGLQGLAIGRIAAASATQS